MNLCRPYKETANGRIDVVGLPNFQQDTGLLMKTTVSAKFQGTVDMVQATAAPGWGGSVTYAAGPAHFTEDNNLRVDDPLVANHCLLNVQLEPDGGNEQFGVDMRTQLELRKLIISKQVRENVERCVVDPSEFTWDVAAPGVVQVPICIFNRLPVEYHDDNEPFEHSPLCTTDTMRVLPFTYDPDQDLYTSAAQVIRINTDQLIFRTVAGGAFSAVGGVDIAFTVPTLSTKKTNRAGYCLFGNNTGTETFQFDFTRIPMYTTAELALQFTSVAAPPVVTGLGTVRIQDFLKSGDICIQNFAISNGETIVHNRPPMSARVDSFPSFRYSWPVLMVNTHAAVGNIVNTNAATQKQIYVRYTDTVAAGRRFHVYAPAGENFLASPLHLKGTKEAANNDMFLQEIARDDVLDDGEKANHIAANPLPPGVAAVGQVLFVTLEEYAEGNATPVGLPSDEYLTSTGNAINLGDIDLGNVLDPATGIGTRAFFPTNTVVGRTARLAPTTFRTGFSFDQVEPLFSWPGGYSLYRDVYECGQFHKAPSVWPLLVQDYKLHLTKQENDTCIVPSYGRLNCSIGNVTVESYQVSDQTTIQDMKGSSLINLSIPKALKQQSEFTTIAVLSPPTISFELEYGPPDAILVYVEYDYLLSGDTAEKRFAKIDSIRVQHDGEFIRTFERNLGAHELRELTRRNCHPYAERHENIVFLKQRQYLQMYKVDPTKRSRLRFQLQSVDELPNYLAQLKTFVVTLIYDNTLSFQGTRDEVRLIRFFPQ